MEKLLAQLTFLGLMTLVIQCGVPSAWGKKRNPWPKVCESRARMLKDCKVGYNNIRIQFWQGKIFVNNGINRSLIEFALSGDEVMWDLVQMVHWGDRTFLEIKVWGSIEKVSQVQPLHWIIYEIVDHQGTLKLDEVIQRRKVARDDQGKIKYSHDRLLPTSLKAKGPNVEWAAGLRSGKF